MKVKVISFFAFLLVTIMVAIPTFAANSGYGYNMYYKVDGKAQGNYHSLGTGSVDISGHSYYTGTHYSGADSSDEGETVTQYLYKDDSWADSYYGKVTQYVSSNATMYKIDNFEGTFPTSADVSSSKYYLVITKSDNGWKMSGSGEIAN